MEARTLTQLHGISSKSVRACEPDPPKQVDSENAKLVADYATNDFDSVGEDNGEMFKSIGRRTLRLYPANELKLACRFHGSPG